MNKNKIVIDVDGGAIHDVRGIPAGIVIEIRDRDCEGGGEENIKKVDGDRMYVSTFKGPRRPKQHPFQKIVANWTSMQADAFVEDLACVMDALAEKHQRDKYDVYDAMNDGECRAAAWCADTEKFDELAARVTYESADDLRDWLVNNSNAHENVSEIRVVDVLDGGRGYEFVKPLKAKKASKK